METMERCKMALFDRFSARLLGDRGRVDKAESDALDLIGQGNSLEAEGQYEQALACYERALLLAPNLARAHLNRGNILLELGDAQAALAAYETALVHNPTYAAANYNMGNALVRMGRREAALAAYHKAIDLKSDFVDAHVALGATLDDLGKFEAAAKSYRHALALQPDYAQVHSNLGNALTKLGQFGDAAASYRRALEIDPDYAEAHNNLGNALKDLGRLSQAETCYRRALGLNPAYTDAHSNLLFVLNYSDDCDPSRSLSEAQLYGATVKRQARASANNGNHREPERCLRVGFVSGDFRTHPVSYFFDSVLDALVRQTSGRLEFFCYSNHPDNDSVTERIKSLCSGWRSIVELPDELAAMRIKDDEIDILIDIAGHTAHNRLPLFAWKPAPVQVSWLGYFATTGVAAIDYLIADPWTLPEGEEVNFTEKIWRLPETRLCFTPPDADVEVNPLPALINGYLTFGCFNNLTKMNDQVVNLWARLLAALPDSRLFLKSAQFKEISTQQSVAERFAACGIVPTRLMMEGLSSRAEYLKTYQRVDIALDPFPYTGGTTTCEALWMGVPVMTLTGERFLSRQGVGLLMNAGLPEWIASNAEGYVARAVLHAADLKALALLRANLRQQVLASPLFDASRFASHFEAALRNMWQRWCTQ
ncbi:MAG: tetratricopeptide repeat protein [Comamonadaceae bacterium]